MDSEERFKIYVDRYTECCRITPEEALKHKIVQEVKKYYKEEEELSK